MKAVFMGTPEFAVPTLQALIDHHEVLAVVTQPDKQRGRGKKMQFPPVKEKAVEYDIPVYQPQRARDEEFIEELKKPQPRCDRCCCLWTDLTRKYLKIFQSMDVSMFMDHSFQNTEEQHRSSGQSLMEKKRQESQPCIWKKD